MMKRTLILASLLFLSHFVLFAQAPSIEWQKCLGGNYMDYGTSVVPTADGGYIMTGYIMGGGGDVTGFHSPTESADCWVVKMDHNGAVQWNRALGGRGFDQGKVIRQTPDGGYIVGASSFSAAPNGDVAAATHGNYDWWVIKLDGSGNISWQKQFGGTSQDFISDIQLTADGGYLMTGYCGSNDGDISGFHGGIGCLGCQDQ